MHQDPRVLARGGDVAQRDGEVVGRLGRVVKEDTADKDVGLALVEVGPLAEADDGATVADTGREQEQEEEAYADGDAPFHDEQPAPARDAVSVAHGEDPRADQRGQSNSKEVAKEEDGHAKAGLVALVPCRHGVERARDEAGFAKTEDDARHEVASVVGNVVLEERHQAPGDDLAR